MRRSLFVFAVLFAATSAAAFSGPPAADSPNANAVIDGAFAAVSGATPAVAPARDVIFAPADPATGALGFAPTGPATTPTAFAPAVTLANAPADRPVAAPPPAAPTIVITVDKSTQRMSVKVNGVERWNWAVSTGRRGYATPTGTFRPFRMAKDHRSREWDNAPMPYSIFFSQRGHAIHGSSAVSRLGTPASHGCVRLNTNNARELFALVRQHGVSNATVIITGAERAPAAIARNGDTPARPQARSHPRTQPNAAPARRTVQPTAHRTVATSQPAPGQRPMQIAPRGFAPAAL